MLRDDTDTQDFWTRFFDAAIVKVSEPIRYPRIVGESEPESMHSQRGSTTLFTLYSSDELLVFSSVKLINTNPNLSSSQPLPIQLPGISIPNIVAGSSRRVSQFWVPLVQPRVRRCVVQHGPGGRHDGIEETDTYNQV